MKVSPSRIIFLGMLLTAAWVLVVGRPRPREAVPADVTRITYWEKWAKREGDQMRSIVDDFNRTVGREKKIHVDYLSISGVDRKTLTATAAGVPPDIAGLWDAQVVQFSHEGALEPLDAYAAQYPHMRPDDFKDVYRRTCTIGGQLWGFVSTPAAAALHYNKRHFYENADALRAAGLDPTRPPRTIDELDRYAIALDTRTPRGSIDRAGYLPMEPGWWITSTSYWFGGSIYDPQTDRFSILIPANRAAMAWIRGYSERLGQDAVSEFRGGLGSFDSPQNAFLSGKVSMVQQGPWMANYIAMHKPEMSQVLVPFALEPFLPRIARPFNYEWGVEAFPSSRPELTDVTVAQFDVLVIPRGSKHKREAFEFIAYVNRPEVMEKLNRLHCKNSPRKVVSEQFIFTHPNPYIDIFNRLADSPNAQGSLPTPLAPHVGSELGNAITAIATLSDSVDAAMQTAAERIDRRHAKFQKEEQRRQEAQARQQAQNRPQALNHQPPEQP